MPKTCSEVEVVFVLGRARVVGMRWVNMLPIIIGIDFLLIGPKSYIPKILD